MRLRGFGPQIVQRGLSIHYELTDVREIERHEAAAIVEQVLASDRPWTLLRAMAEHVDFKLSPILQQVNLSTPSPASDQLRAQTQPPPAKEPPPESSKGVEPTAPVPPLPVPSPQLIPSPTLTVISNGDSSPLSTKSSAPSTESWYLVHAKPRQEDVALANLERQGYACYLPQMRIERVRRRKAEVATEPMFPRYLFVRLVSSDQSKS